MVNSINTSLSNIMPINLLSSNRSYDKFSSVSLNNFDIEDKAIISAQAKMLNELDKYNSGSGNEVDLALAQVQSKIHIGAVVNVINAKLLM